MMTEPISPCGSITTSLEKMRLLKGKVVMLDSWASRMEYGGERNKDRHFLNAKNAVKAEIN